DFNGDGIDDVGIVPWALGNTLARAYVVFGREDPPRTLDLENLGRGGFKITGTEGMRFSSGRNGIMAGGDFDGDGKRDLAIGGAEDRKSFVWILYGGERLEGVPFVRGEANSDGNIDLSDAV